MALHSVIFCEGAKWYKHFLYLEKKKTSSVSEQCIKIQASKFWVQTLKSGIVWINISLVQQIDSKAIFREQLKKGIQGKTYLPKQVFNAYKFGLF